MSNERFYFFLFFISLGLMACVQMRPIAVDGLKWSVSASVNNGYDRVPCKATGKTGAKKRRVVDGARIPFGEGG